MGLAGWAAGCTPYAFVPVDAHAPDGDEVDEDPIALLPPRPLVFGRIDPVSLFATPLGAQFAAFLQSIMPLGPDANFSAARDVTKFYLGAYAMAGVDVCAVLQGRFDVAAIRRSADARAQAGQLAHTRYAGYDLYTVNNLGFVPLTAKTTLAGDTTGLRRALDRLRYDRVERAVPEWMVQLAEIKNTGLALAGDFGARDVFMARRAMLERTTPAAPPAGQPSPPSIATPILEASAGDLPFLHDLRVLRIIGNFLAPGLNVAGTLTYASATSAVNGAEAMKSAAQMAQWASMLTSFFGPSLPPIQVAVSGSDVGFVQSVDAELVKALIQFVK